MFILYTGHFVFWSCYLCILKWSTRLVGITLCYKITLNICVGWVWLRHSNFWGLFHFFSLCAKLAISSEINSTISGNTMDIKCVVWYRCNLVLSWVKRPCRNELHKEYCVKTKLIPLDWKWVTLICWCQMNCGVHSSPDMHKIDGKTHYFLEILRVKS